MVSSRTRRLFNKYATSIALPSTLALDPARQHLLENEEQPIDLFKKIVDECAELGITHVRMHNYGEAFIDRKLVRPIVRARSSDATYSSTSPSSS